MNYKRIWDELELDELDSSMYTARQIYPESMITMYLAVDKEKNKRSLLIAVDGICVQQEKFPFWKGMYVDVKRFTIGKNVEKEFLILGNNVRETNDIYEAVIFNIVEVLKECIDVHGFQEILVKILKKWQYFFESNGYEGLSEAAQKGLYGELWMLRNLIECMEPEKALSGWTGCRRASHDFQYPNGSLEVKTTSTKQHQKVHIHNEIQLDDDGLPALYLCILAVNEMENAGETLLDIIQQLRSSFTDNYSCVQKFEQCIYDAGYLDIHANMYANRYVKRYCKIFKVQEGFPRLIERDLPNGIGDLNYSVALAACSEFEVDLGCVLKDISQGEK